MMADIITDIEIQKVILSKERIVWRPKIKGETDFLPMEDDSADILRRDLINNYGACCFHFIKEISFV